MRIVIQSAGSSEVFQHVSDVLTTTVLTVNCMQQSQVTSTRPI